jgi:hypothetical protein
MENLYKWHAEVMVSLEMEEFRKEMDSIRLLHDAGLANPGYFQRVLIGLGNALVKFGQRLQENITNPHQAYQITSSKYAA